jgi:hypothetical protein|nr:MAG TPA: hypothetical protein [Caudoviricetes sp.]DAX82038.1 MAG TPA: hypothetical protein [Caudoviricetes sp.]
MMPQWFMTVIRNNTRVFITSLAALILGLFFFLIPIEVLQLTWARGFEVWYFRILGAVASVTLPGVVTHFIIWDSQNK